MITIAKKPPSQMRCQEWHQPFHRQFFFSPDTQVLNLRKETTVFLRYFPPRSKRIHVSESMLKVRCRETVSLKSHSRLYQSCLSLAFVAQSHRPLRPPQSESVTLDGVGPTGLETTALKYGVLIWNSSELIVFMYRDITFQ